MAARILTSLGFVASAAATALPRADAPRGSSGFVSFPIEHRNSVVAVMKRADTGVPLLNVSVISYLVEMSIGTPGQRTKVAIDTGSDELWVNPQCSTVKSNTQRIECDSNGQYEPGSSTTSVQSDATAHIPYGKGEVNIQYFKDSISLPQSSISLKNVIFGVATASDDLSEGILGLGYGNNVNLEYNNFVDTLYAQNVTSSRAFTITLGSAEANNGGAIVFGGLDTKKFSGNLTRVPILGPQGKETVRRYWVQLDSIGITPDGGSTRLYSNSKMPIVIDSGSSLSYLPSAIVTKMANDTGAQWDDSASVYIVPCSQMSSSATFDFTFSGASSGPSGSGPSSSSPSSAVKISVPYREFMWRAGANDCILGALPLTGSSGVTALLGDSFMRSATLVFDQTSDSIYMGQFANCGSNERAIPTDASGVAGLAGECNPGQGVGVATGGSGSGSKNGAARMGAGPGAVWFGTAAVVVAQVLMSV